MIYQEFKVLRYSNLNIGIGFMCLCFLILALCLRYSAVAHVGWIVRMVLSIYAKIPSYIISLVAGYYHKQDYVKGCQMYVNGALTNFG